MIARTRLLPGCLAASQLLGMQAHRYRATPARSTYRLGFAGYPAKVPTLLITILDDSGSVTSPAGTDPLSNRYAEVTRAFTIVARHGARDELGAVVHFDTPCGTDVQPTPIARRGVQQLRTGLAMPPDGAGSSKLGPSLAAATSLAVTYAGYQATLVVLSDFYLLDPDPGTVLAELGAFPGDVHVVVLGGRDCRELFADRVTVTPIKRDDPPGAVAAAIFASLTRHRPGSRAYAEATGAMQ